MADTSTVQQGPRSHPARGLFLPSCLVAFAIASAALGFSFYFRGRAGDYNLYYLTAPESHLNEYVPAEASRELAFPLLDLFASGWAAAILVAWLLLARRLARRERTDLRDAFARAAAAFAPLVALILIPAHHYLRLPLTLAPVFLMIVCIALCAAIGAYLASGTGRDGGRGTGDEKDVEREGVGRRALGVERRAQEIRDAPRSTLHAPPPRLASGIFSVWGAWAVSLVYIVVVSVLSVREYHALHCGFWDSGLYGEAITHASRGGPLRTNLAETGLVLQWHCELILVPIAWLYRLWPRHEMLLILQTVGMGLGGVAVYLIGHSVLRHRFAAWVLAVAYLVAPTTLFVNLPSTHGFRPLTLLVPALLWAVAFFERGSRLWGFLFLLLALVAKEEAAPAVVMVGVFLALRHRRLGTAAGAIALGIAWFVLVTHVIQPMALDRPYQFVGHFERFGTTPGGVLGSVVSRPLAAAGYILGELQKVFFLLHLVVPLLLLPLLSPSAALVGAANFVLLTLAAWYGKHLIITGAQAPVLPGLYLAAAYGLRNLSRREGWLLRRVLPARLFGDRERVLRAAAVGVLAASLLSFYFLFFRTMPWGRFIVTDHARLVPELRERIPRDASLCASYRLATHFTDQRDLYVAPSQLTLADYVALDLYDEWAGLATMADYRTQLLRSPRHAAVFAKDGFLLFQRGAKGSGLASAYKLAQPPQPRYPCGTALEGFATLLGYDAKDTPRGLDLTLYWRCERATALDYACRLTLATGEPGRERRIGWFYLPADGLVPTWAWRPGEIIADRFTVPGLAAPPGRPPVAEVALQALPAGR